jgi:hypothetical protein
LVFVSSRRTADELNACPLIAGYVRRCGTARGSDRPDIDIHLLVDPAPGSKLLDLLSLGRRA